MDRRTFLALSAALATSVTARSEVASRHQRSQIDVHHHVFPPPMRKALTGRLPDAVLPDELASLRQMDASNTLKSVISFPNSDITTLPEDQLTELIRASNDYAVGIVERYPTRYGLFASLPMPYVDASLRELERICSARAVCGVLLISNYGSRWLGDKAFAPLLDELNRRALNVYVHPNAADCCRGLLPGVSDSIVEFQTDTSRTIASLLFTGTAERVRDIRFLFSHSGGTLPSLIERFVSAAHASPGLEGTTPEGVMWYLKRFFYDTAQTANRTALGALLDIVPDTQVMFGSDFPYRTAAEQVLQLESMQLGRATLGRILTGNATQFLARGPREIPVAATG